MLEADLGVGEVVLGLDFEAAALERGFLGLEGEVVIDNLRDYGVVGACAGMGCGGCREGEAYGAEFILFHVPCLLLGR